MTTEARQARWFVGVLRQRSVQIALGVWVAFIVAIYSLSHGTLPFNRPAVAGLSFRAQVVAAQFGFLWAFLFIWVTYLVTRRRTPPDMASRAPAAPAALREIVLLLSYGAFVLAMGQVVGHAVGGHGIGLHLPGSLFGMTDNVAPREVWVWAAYNFIFYAVIPYLVFRGRGYSRESLNLKSVNLKNDTLLIFVVLILESAADLATGKILSLTARQIVLGGSLSFVVHLFGTGLPVMIFIYSILLPRYMRLSGSVVTTTLLGGLTYAAVHLFEYWTVYDSAAHGILSVIFILFMFVPPGMVKSFLTLRTGNAWVHLWGWHVIAPHVTADTPIIVKIFGIR